MKKSILYFIFFILIVSSVNAQFCNYYQSSLDVTINPNPDVLELNNAYYKIETESNSQINFHTNIRIIKTDAAGFVKWIKRYDAGPDSSLNTYSLNKTLDNKLIICAQLANDNALQPIGISLIKIDTSGTIKWTALFPGYRGESYSKQVLQLPDSSFIIPALTPATLKLSFILLSANGSSVTAKQLQNTVYSFSNDLTTIALKNNVVSFCLSQGEFITTDQSLNIISDKTYNLQHSIPYFIHTITANGDYVFISDITSGATQNGTFRIFRTTPTGSLIWAKNVIAWESFTNHIPATRFDVVLAKTIIEDPAGNIIAHVADENSGGLAVKFDANGNYLTNKTIPAVTMKLCNDGQYLYQSNITGHNQSLFAKQPLTIDSCDSLIDVHVSNGTDSVSNAATSTSLATMTISLLPFTIHSASATSSISAYCASAITSLHESGSKDFKGINIYPNPVLNTLHVTLEKLDVPTEMRIFDVFGKTVWFGNFPGSDINLDASNFAEGTYIIEVTTQSHTFHKKFIKR